MHQCTDAPTQVVTLYGYESHADANPNPNPIPTPNQVVTLYGYESHDYVQPSTYPLESVTPTNVDIAITETGAGAQKVGTFSASLEGTNTDNPNDLSALSFQQVSPTPIP